MHHSFAYVFQLETVVLQRLTGPGSLFVLRRGATYKVSLFFYGIRLALLWYGWVRFLLNPAKGSIHWDWKSCHMEPFYLTGLVLLNGTNDFCLHSTKTLLQKDIKPSILW